MVKSIAQSFLALFLASSFFGTTAQAKTFSSSENETVPESRAVEVHFFGGITGFDEPSYKVLKAAMASLLIEGVIDHYITTGRGMEGGSSFCVELSSNPAVTLDKVTEILKTIRPVNQTVYKYSPITACSKSN